MNQLLMPLPVAWTVICLAALLPGAAMVALARPRTDRAGALGLALALSPVLGGIGASALRAAGVSWGGGLTAMLAAAAVVCGVAWRTRSSAREEPSGAPRSVWWFTALGVLLIGGLLIASEWWRIASDAWTHEPLVRAIRQHGVPPGDPLYFGFRIQYQWIYHAWVAALQETTGIDAFSLMAFLAVGSFAALALAAGSLAHRLHRRHVGWTLALLLLGLNALLPALLSIPIARALLGEATNPQHVAAMFHGVWTDADRAGDLLRSIGGQTWFGNKFTGATPLSLGLAALAAWAASFVRFADGDRTRGECAILAITTLSACLMHPAILVFLAITGVVIGAGVLVLPALRRIWGGRGLLAFGAAMLAGGLSAGLYYAWMMAPAAGKVTPPLDFSPPRIMGLVACSALGLVLLPFAIKRLLLGEAKHRAWLLLMSGAALSALCIRLPGEWPFFTVDKTSYLLWLPLAIGVGPVLGRFAARLPRTATVALSILLFAPVTALAWVSMAADARAGRHQSWDAPDLVALRRQLPADALLLAPPGDLDTPVFVARDLYDSDKFDGVLRGYPSAELERRHAWVDSLYRAGRPAPELLEHLASAGRPVFALWPNHTGSAWQSLAPGVSHRKFVCSGMRPTWEGTLPVVRIGEAYAVTPLTPGAHLIGRP